MQVTPPERYVNHSQVKPERNLSMECCKLVASFLVVFIHASLPGDLGGILSTLGRFSVPLFFMISGYFNYGSSSETVFRRTKHIIKLVLSAMLIHTILGCIATEIESGSMVSFLRGQFPDPSVLMRWIMLQADPVAGHLWYLHALVVCYLFLLAYVRFYNGQQVNYRALYSISFYLFTFLFVFDVISPLTGDYTFYDIIHTGWFFGIPMFGFGIFIGEYQQRIFSGFQLTTRKLLCLAVVSVLLSLLQRKIIGTGIIPFGAIFGVPALMLFLVDHPKVPVLPEKLIARLGPISTWIYILHIIIIIYYDKFFQKPLEAIFADHAEYVRPLFAAGVSLLAAITVTYIQQLIRYLRKK